MPFIGDLLLSSIHRGALQPYIDARRKGGKIHMINRAQQVVRHMLNLAANE
jgi:hypothetical protein